VFARRADCFEAIRQFDGKKAAGQEIYLTLLDDQGIVSSLRSRFARNEDDGGRRRGDGRRENKQKRGHQKKTPEELDAELDAYMSGKPAEGTGESGVVADNNGGTANLQPESQAANDEMAMEA
jgi:hypothetical protein